MYLEKSIITVTLPEFLDKRLDIMEKKPRIIKK